MKFKLIIKNFFKFFALTVLALMFIISDVSYSSASGIVQMSPKINFYHSGGVQPDAVAIGKNGNIWVANLDSKNLTKLSPNGDIIGNYACGNLPSAIAIAPNGNVWITDGGYRSGRIVKLSSDGAMLGMYRIDNPGVSPTALTIASNGNVWVVNNNNTVTKLSPNGTIIGNYGPKWNPDLNVNLDAMAIDKNGNLWVASGSGRYVLEFEGVDKGSISH